MGLIKDVLGSALGGDQIKNGFSNNRLSSAFGQNSAPSSGQQQYSSYSNGPDYSRRDPRAYNRSPNYPPSLPPRSRGNDSSDNYNNRRSYQDDDRYNNDYSDTNRSYPNAGQLQPPPGYSRQPSPQGYNNGYNNDYNDYQQDSGYASQGGRDSFRPLALPQISYGDGSPFLRGYSRELQRYNISFRDFMQILDAINVAIIPNPENQIFQKGANIAGWFLPGAAGIGLTVGQIGLGLGTAMGHSSAIAKVLSKANIELFVPNGLEICIGKSKDVENEVGISLNGGPGPGARPEDRVAVYGNYLAPLTDVLPPLQNSGGRSDPLAMLGQRFSDKSSDKQLRKAQEDIQKGKTKKFDALEGGLQWIMVRRASPSAMDHAQQMLQQSNAAMRQEQQAQQVRPGRY